MDYMVLINRKHRLKKEIKFNLEYVCKNYDGEDIYLEKRTKKAALKMLKDVNTIYGKDRVVLESGYRSLNKQQEILDYYLCEEGENAYFRVALPGTSEHHTGLCVDVDISNSLNDPTGEEDEMKWLKENAYKYGFILRYPKGKEKIHGYRYEPWHFRYVGSVSLAKNIKDSGLTLEEYTEKVKC